MVHKFIHVSLKVISLCDTGALSSIGISYEVCNLDYMHEPTLYTTTMIIVDYCLNNRHVSPYMGFKLLTYINASLVFKTHANHLSI